MFGLVIGAGDPCFELHRDVARQVLALGGIGLDELREWLAVLEARQSAPESPQTP